MRQRFNNLVYGGIYIYLAGLLVWAILHVVFGDRWWWLFLLNSFSAYAFVPLPLVALVAMVARRRVLWGSLATAIVLGVWLHGAAFVPTGRTVQASHGPTLTVMTYNLLGFNTNVDGVVAALQRSGADVVSLQELNPAMAAAIEQRLGVEYPYQELYPQEGTSGHGLISRYPLYPAELSLAGTAWEGRAHIVRELDVYGQHVLFMHFHAVPTNLGKPSFMEHSLRVREQQARDMVALAQRYDGPFVAAGDFNATDMSAAYDIVTTSLQDAWRQAGWGLGQTFPGAASQGSSRLSIMGVPVPMWLVRIDYVFHSAHVQALNTWIGPWDGASDHRPVMAELVLR
jgi:endonuclease/exonuclease/phosphatase (EEP) superfamily protein YafD